MNVASIKKRLQKSLRWLQPGSPRKHLQLGIRGERAAEKYLKRQHYKIITRNYECSSGEIDLIARDGDTLVFVEVRTRSSRDPIRPAEIITPAKWSHVEKTARYFLMKKSLQHLPCRFDLVTVHMPDGKSPNIEHFPDAYQPRRR